MLKRIVTNAMRYFLKNLTSAKNNILNLRVTFFDNLKFLNVILNLLSRLQWIACDLPISVRKTYHQILIPLLGCATLKNKFSHCTIHISNLTL